MIASEENKIKFIFHVTLVSKSLTNHIFVLLT